MTALALLAQAASLPASSSAPPAPPEGSTAVLPTSSGRTLAPEQLLLLTVILDGSTLTEGMSGFVGEGDEFYLPVAELSRLLDLDIQVSVATGRITGRLGVAERPLTIDLEQGFARTGGDNLRITPEAWGRTAGDIFIRADVLEQLLPVKFKLDLETLQLTLTATEKLPIQARAERERRIDSLSRQTDGQLPVMRIPANYALASVPSFDFTFESGYDRRTALFGRRYDVRAAGDFLGSAFSAYLGSDQVGDPSTARIKFERKSVDGTLLGPLKANYVALGDIYTPGLPLGPASATGRGFTFSTAPAAASDIFQQVTLRGELPIGYQVELYVNDILRSGQRTPVNGRYEFIDVPLTRGLNVLRVVLYGPHGERSEDVRVLNVGGGQLPAGTLTIDAGISQQGKDAIPLQGGDEITTGDLGEGKLRTVFSLGYGLSSITTLRAGAAFFADAAGRQRALATASLRTSALGLSTSLDYARDSTGGSAASVALAGEPLGVSVSGRHVEYTGGFLDENSRFGSANRPLERDTGLDVNFALPFLQDGRLPIGLRLGRTQYVDGVDWVGSARASSVVANTLVSLGLDYRRDVIRNLEASDRLTGNLTLSRLIGYSWQLRSSTDFEILPSAAVRAFTLTADKALSDDLSLRLGAGRSFGENAETQLQTSAAWRLPFAEVALSGDLVIERREYRVGLRVSFGIARDPWRKRMRMTPPGIAAGGSAAVYAFLDQNADGIPDAGEEGMEGIVITGGMRSATTDAQGRALVMGLGEGPTTQIHANSTNIDAFYVQGPPQDIEMFPRAGTVIPLAYPFVPVSEVFATLRTADASGRKVGLSAVRVQLLAEGKPPINGITEFDGTVIFDNVPSGTYRLQLDPEQASRLRMKLSEVPTVEVEGDGGVPELEAEIVFERE